ncbi:general stress protein [Marisediminicola senii]|uniref:general stress protein n=1 Tax=Marisediminicola senii TaxID=2711233 RepID=UPI0013EBDD03|nr:general stress protein [Marisediminicola senii]
MPSPFARRSPVSPSLPRGDVLGSYETYLEAQAVVDHLAKAEFPVKQVSIVGSGLKSVERVTGKLTWAKAAGAGALSGAWIGLFFGLVLFLFSTEPASFVFVGAAVLIGAGFGMAFAIVSYALNRRRRDFTSVNQVMASAYEVIVDPNLTVRAQELMDRPLPKG